MRNSFLGAAAAAALMAASSAGAGTWVPANPPPNSTSVLLFGITQKDMVTGSFVDTSGLTHGFVGPFDGSNYTTFDDSGTGTTPRALNDKGAITGYDTGTLIPWERSADGTITNVTKKGTTLNQLAQGINKKGVFAGNYDDSNSISVGYLGKNAKYSKKIKLSIKNSGYAGRAINDAGDIGGWYYDSSMVQHGYVIIGGKATGVDYPGAAYTVVEGLNGKGSASGFYSDSAGVLHGFIYEIKSGKFTSLDAPGAALTQAWSINDDKVVAVSADVGSFAYCAGKKSCPAAGVVRRREVTGRYTPPPP